MPPPAVIELPGLPPIPILHEDEGCLVIDKPGGWWCAPEGEETGPRNLRRILDEEIAAGAPWARSRELDFLHPAHFLDTEAGGLLLLARSPDATERYSRLVADRRTLKEFLAVAGGKPPKRAWTCCLKVRPDPDHPERALAHTTRGFHAETEFEAIGHGDGLVLLVARPRTSRPHQIRVHLADAGIPILGDALYGFGRKIAPRTRRAHLLAEGRGPRIPRPDREPLALRAIHLAFTCPFSLQPVDIGAPFDEFLARYGFAGDVDEESDPESV